jgi:hypothetical protein
MAKLAFIKRGGRRPRADRRFLRRRGTLVHFPDNVEALPVGSGRPTFDDPVEHVIRDEEAREAADLLERTLKGASPQQRAVARTQLKSLRETGTLARWEDIGRELNMSASTARVHWHRLCRNARAHCAEGEQLRRAA